MWYMVKYTWTDPTTAAELDYEPDEVFSNTHLAEDLPSANAFIARLIPGRPGQTLQSLVISEVTFPLYVRNDYISRLEYLADAKKLGV